LVAVGGSFGLAVTVDDDLGNAVPDFIGPDTISIASGPAGGTLAGNTTVTAASGVATFSGLSLSKGGTYTLEITGGGLTTMVTISPGTLAINGSASGASDNVSVTFSSPTQFTLTANGQTVDYSTTQTNGFTYTGPGGSTYSQFVFDDPMNTYSVTQTLSGTTLTSSSGYQLALDNVGNLFIYGNDNSTATVNVANTTGSNNFFVDAANGSYSYIANPGTGAYSELSGFGSETITGSSGSTYAYIYSTTDATTVASPTQTTFTVGGVTSTLTNFPQVYVVGAADGTDSITLDSAGNEFVSSPGYSYVTNGTSVLMGAIYAADVTAQASSGGKDSAVFYSYPSNTFNGASGTSTLSGSTLNVKQATFDFTSQALGYLNVSVFESGGGTDTANLTSSGAGSLFSTASSTALTIGTSVVTVNTYYAPSGQIVALAGTIVVTGAGSDTADLYDSTGANALSATGTTATLTAGSRSLSINKFATVTANQTSGTGDTVHEAANLGFTLTTVGSWTSD
jgi:hypothetical protein